MPQSQRKPSKPRKVVRTPDTADPAQEWGERIETGKMIARGGKSTGYVPGATENGKRVGKNE